MKRVQNSLRFIQVFTLCMVLVVSLVNILIPPRQAGAVSGSDFVAGRIIDDDVFTNPYSMSVGEIQSFLNSQMTSCDPWGVKASEYGGGSRAQYAASQGQPTPFTCLKDYYEVPKNSPGSGIPASNYGGNPIPTGAQSAAQLIYNAGVQYSISPKVLLVTLQKEQGLLSDEWPFRRQYLYAMGAHCPDSGPNGSANCDSNYAGFSLQIAESASLFRYYLDNMTQPWWPYKKVGLNYIQYHPNVGCGGTNVSIENKSTAGLYTYTPYQPNAAALNNMYGTGDGCSSYGNRNFWRMYNDWFGSTYGSYLLRSPENATVYLVSEDTKFPIADGNLLGALYTLGQVKFVSQQFLNSKTTGGLLQRLIRGPDGTIYFFDAGIKLPFTSCTMIEEYGLGSGCGNYANLSSQILSKLVTGPSMTAYFGTNNGKNFYIDNAQKHEVFDQAALQANNLGGAFNVLTEPALYYLSYGAPVMRNNTVAQSRTTSAVCVYQNNACLTADPKLISQTILRTLPSARLDQGSMQQLSSSGTLTGFVRNVGNTDNYVLDKTGKARLTAPSEWSASFVVMSDSLLSQLGNSSQSVNNDLIKSESDGTVYFVDSQQKRAISAWDDLLRLNITPLVINTLSDTTVAAMTSGPMALGPGTMVKYPSDATVYVIDGTTGKIPVSSFGVTNDLGITPSIRTVSASTLDAYTTAASILSVKVTCNSKNYVGAKGKLYEVDTTAAEHYNFTYQTLDGMTCATLPKASTKLYRFLRSDNGTIYYVENGTKRAFRSWQNYLNQGGSASNTVWVSDITLRSLPDGSLI